MNLRDFSGSKDRKKTLEKELGISLENVEKAFVDNENEVHCENLIGAVSIPLGVAGPLKITNDELQITNKDSQNTKNKNYYIPLATTEGALIASVSRGCKAISECEGANVHVHKVGATRGPVFFTGSLEKSIYLYNWIKDNTQKLAEVAESTSSHLTFKNVELNKLADHVFARFSFETDQAMGMNMVTIATQKIVEKIEEETGISALAVAGNFDIDKKPAWMNFHLGRGYKAWAEVIITKEVLEKVLKTNAQLIFNVWLGKCMYGSAMSGSLGFNCHFANIVAAFYAATGQDLAHVVEGSHGMTTVRIQENGDLYFSVYMPAVMLGTVGGGTKLKTQTEARNLIKTTNDELRITNEKQEITVEELAEVLVGAVLAGELSLLASLSQGSLAKAHKSLGR